MRALRAIAGRDLGSFFHGAMAPIVVTVFLLLTGFFFVDVLFDYSEMSRSALASGRLVRETLNLADGVFQPLASNMALFLLFLMPAVTMRLFAEEYRSGRYGLLATYPVPDHLWVGGKFLAALAVGGVLILASSVNFAVTGWLGHPEPGPLIAAAVGLLLLTALFAAWGVFFSSLMQYQVVGYILTFAFLALLFSVGNLEPHLPPGLAPLAGRLSLTGHFARFTRGVIDSRDVVYFLGWILVGLSAATASYAGKRLAGSRRWVRWSPTLALAVLMVVVELIAARAPASLDLTRDKRRSLAPQTVRVLESVDADVSITAFYQRLDPNRQGLEDLLRSFADRAPGLRWEMLDPTVELGRMRDLGVTTERAVIVGAEGRRRSVLDPDESDLVNAIFRVVAGTQPVVYVVQGHGERRLDDTDRDGFAAAVDAAERQGYDLRRLVLLDAPRVPGDADVVVLPGPRQAFAAEELRALDAFLARGGAVLLLLDEGTHASVNAWIERYNVQASGDVLVSASRANEQLRLDPLTQVIVDYPVHEITRGLDGMATLFPRAQSLLPVAQARVGVEAHTLIRSDQRSWSEGDPQEIAEGRLEFEEGEDVPGPLPLAVVLEIDREAYFDLSRLSQVGLQPDEVFSDDPAVAALQQVHREGRGQLPPSIFQEDSTSRLVVAGDVDFAANSALNLYGNRDFLLNTLSWLARERTLVAPRARGTFNEPVVLTADQKDLLGWGCSVAWPLAAGLVCVVLVWGRRRHH